MEAVVLPAPSAVFFQFKTLFKSRHLPPRQNWGDDDDVTFDGTRWPAVAMAIIYDLIRDGNASRKFRIKASKPKPAEALLKAYAKAHPLDQDVMLWLRGRAVDPSQADALAVVARRRPDPDRPHFASPVLVVVVGLTAGAGHRIGHQ